MLDSNNQLEHPFLCTCPPVSRLQIRFAALLFFSRWWNATHAVGSAHAVELTHAHREAEALRKATLHVRAGGRRMALAVIQHPGEDLPAQLRGVAVSPLDERVLAFGLDVFEQPIHRRAMHWDRAVSPCFRGIHPLLDLPDNLPPGYLACLLCLSWPTLVRCFWRYHRWQRHHFDHLHHFALLKAVCLTFFRQRHDSIPSEQSEGSQSPALCSG